MKTDRKPVYNNNCSHRLVSVPCGLWELQERTSIKGVNAMWMKEGKENKKGQVLSRWVKKKEAVHPWTRVCKPSTLEILLGRAEMKGVNI